MATSTPNLHIPLYDNSTPADWATAFNGHATAVDTAVQAKVDAIDDRIDPLAADTGWVNCSVASGFSAQGGTPMQVRKVGKIVYARWGYSSTGFSPNAAHQVGAVPAGFRPTNTAYAMGVSSSPALAPRIEVAASGAITITTPSTVGSYYLASLGTCWFTDAS